MLLNNVLYFEKLIHTLVGGVGTSDGLGGRAVLADGSKRRHRAISTSTGKAAGLGSGGTGIVSLDELAQVLRVEDCANSLRDHLANDTAGLRRRWSRSRECAGREERRDEELAVREHCFKTKKKMWKTKKSAKGDEKKNKETRTKEKLERQDRCVRRGFILATRVAAS